VEYGFFTEVKKGSKALDIQKNKDGSKSSSSSVLIEALGFSKLAMTR
jgi:hypothetical protein